MPINLFSSNTHKLTSPCSLKPMTQRNSSSQSDNSKQRGNLSTIKYKRLKILSHKPNQRMSNNLVNQGQKQISSFNKIAESLTSLKTHKTTFSNYNPDADFISLKYNDSTLSHHLLLSLTTPEQLSSIINYLQLH